jgi:hypothetical protein
MPSCINILHSNTPNSGTCQWTSVQLIRWNLKIQYNLRTSEEGKSTKKKKNTQVLAMGIDYYYYYTWPQAMPRVHNSFLVKINV